MFLEIEGDKLLNIDLVDVVELNHQKMSATLWSGGVNVSSESKIAYRYFMQLPAEKLVPAPKYLAKELV